VRLSGVELDEVGSHDVAQFDKQVDSLISLIVTPFGIPKRIFQGSEQGEKASSQDRGNWDQHVRDRRRQFAESVVLRPLVSRLQMLGQLPETPDGYEARWPDVQDKDLESRLGMAKTAAEGNKNQGEQIVTTNEIRDKILGYDPLEEDELQGVPDQDGRALVARLLAAKRKGRDFSVDIERDQSGRTRRLRVTRAGEEEGGDE
jgi:hypothetical protein